jgi:DNA-3-methyladenine glycosylase II
MTGLDKAMTIIAIMFDGNETARNRMTTHINTDADLDAGIAALIAADPRWSAIVARTGRPPLRRREGGFAGLAQIIVSQQVSVASAAAIHGRLVAIADPFDHTAVLRARKDRLLRVGLSNAKIKTLKAIAKAIDSGEIDLNALAGMPADAAHATLVALHGIGPWTADVYLLACIGHADAWPAGDIALQEAARSAFALPGRPTTKEMGPLADLWRPYRAVAARLLWSYYRVIKQREGLLIQPATPIKKKKTAQPPQRAKPAAPKKKRATHAR